MIRRELKSRLMEVEKQYAAVVQAKRREDTAPAFWAYTHAIEASAVVLYGEPKMEEPLWVARQRALEKLCEEFGAAADELLRAHGKKPLPFFMRNRLCCKLMFDALDGANDNFKFEQIFSKAPDWFLKFTGVECDAKLLGFKLRKLVDAPALGREARHDRNGWPYLPEGTIDAGGPCSDPDEPWETIIARRCHGLR